MTQLQSFGVPLSIIVTATDHIEFRDSHFICPKTVNPLDISIIIDDETPQVNAFRNYLIRFQNVAFDSCASSSVALEVSIPTDNILSGKFLALSSFRVIEIDTVEIESSNSFSFSAKTNANAAPLSRAVTGIYVADLSYPASTGGLFHLDQSGELKTVSQPVVGIEIFYTVFATPFSNCRDLQILFESGGELSSTSSTVKAFYYYTTTSKVPEQGSIVGQGIYVTAAMEGTDTVGIEFGDLVRFNQTSFSQFQFSFTGKMVSSGRAVAILIDGIWEDVTFETTLFTFENTASSMGGDEVTAIEIAASWIGVTSTDETQFQVTTSSGGLCLSAQVCYGLHFTGFLSGAFSDCTFFVDGTIHGVNASAIYYDDVSLDEISFTRCLWSVSATVEGFSVASAIAFVPAKMADVFE